MKNKIKQNSYRIGKTYEELYGVEKAKAFKEKLSLAFKGKKYSEEKRSKYKKYHAFLKGKTLEERFGKERALSIKKRISETAKLTLAMPEVKAKMRICKMGRIMPREIVEKRIATIKKNGGFKQTEYQKLKASIAVKEARKTQIFPVKDTTIEVKIQNYLKQLGIEFYTHQYIKEIEHGYQCDIVIPVQEGINKKTIIECFGTYWHDYPLSREIDVIRCNELREQNYRVLVFWENEIKVMEIEDLRNKLGGIENFRSN